MHTFSSLVSFLAVSGLSAVEAGPLHPTNRQTTPVWETFPPTPALATPINATLSESNGAKLWMQKYNEAAGGIPVVLIHGGGGYSAYMAGVIDRLVKAGKYCIAVDRRGHGRSTYVPTDVWTFDMFAEEISVQLASVGVTKADWVGWSDGAATTYAALQIPAIDATINKAFVFAGFMNPADTNATYTSTKIYGEFITRIQAEFADLQPKGNFTEFATILTKLETDLPQFTEAGLGKIDGKKVAVVSADHDEAVNLDVPAKLLAAIPGSTAIELTGVSHFAPLQDPDQFTKQVVAFLG